MDPDLASRVDSRQLRDAFGLYASGVTIITSQDAEGPAGFTCQAFFSVSLEPPLIAFSVMTSSTTYPRIRESGTFAVNVLAADQGAISSQFARKGADKWGGIAWRPTRSGSPAIDGSLVWLDCDLWAEHAAGDHLIVIGRVVEMSPPLSHDEPLLYYQGAYRGLRTPDIA